MTIKRTFDIVGASIGILLLFPAMALLAAAVKLDSRGPVLFVQTRVGRHEVPFRLFKFRTMAEHPRETFLSAGKDAYVTRVGRFLRRSKMDELPQLLNVLRGEMSLVGPRPEVPKYVEHYPDEVRRTIFSVRPGMTDAASLAFKDEARLLTDVEDAEAVYLREILPRKLELSRLALANGSLLSDVYIIARTIAGLIR